jgi:hypothetical protein
VRLQHVVRSKRKTSACSTRFGEANAINTGMALSRGAAIALINDYTWLPANFVEETLSFFKVMHARSNTTRAHTHQSRKNHYNNMS